MIEMPELCDYLPHKKSMLLLDRIFSWNLEEGILVSGVTVREDSMFFNDELGGGPAWPEFEYMARVFGALSGINTRENLSLPPRIGFIMSIRAYKTTVPVFPAGSDLRIQVNQLYNENSVVSFSCSIFENDSELITATVNAIETEKPEELLGAL